MKLVKKIDHRTDGGSKFKKKPKDIEEQLKKAVRKPVPRKIQKKQDKQKAKKDKKEIKPPPFCRYVEGVNCIYAGLKWIGMADELKKRDKLKRPTKTSNFCRATCLPLVMGKHQVTNFFAMGMTLSKQIAQVIGALNVIASIKQPAPLITERRHPQAPAVSLRTLASEPEKTPKPTRQNVEKE